MMMMCRQRFFELTDTFGSADRRKRGKKMGGGKGGQDQHSTKYEDMHKEKQERTHPSPPLPPSLPPSTRFVPRTSHQLRIATKTIATTNPTTSSRQAALRPALRWYSCALTSSSDAAPVLDAIEVTLYSMLSGGRAGVVRKDEMR